MSALFERFKAASGLRYGVEDRSLCEACEKVIPNGGFGFKIMHEGDRIEFRRDFLPWGKLHIHIVRAGKKEEA